MVKVRQNEQMKNISIPSIHVVLIAFSMFFTSLMVLGQDCSSSEKNCSICLEKMDPFHPGKKSYCLSTVEHEFHPGCLDQWKSTSCPLCRTPINSYFPYLVERLGEYDLLGPTVHKKDLMKI
jgi:hypothetical protein